MGIGAVPCGCSAVQVQYRAAAVPRVVGARLPLDVEAAASKGLLAVANDIHSRSAGTGRQIAERQPEHRKAEGRPAQARQRGEGLIL